ncbi:hypothetical protein H310_08601 [Aphanomyces invadans]|uniref:NAD(P)-binding domain-containing protein n=1 Tax=Aphanomyces invadans TaxID=157072 RepID=A0A024TWS5_9STRA|nr:hypothetical protein H310_08601 [Aphanomyces invadans]ETV98453.1 hypothetical protein H310_08601 [Aphanomyces invadans]|eukprot:XP_008872650.1 hypothetical protein H310_08601 [Aphanomyces invadans]
MACVVHDVSQHLLLVVGGTGYVGSNILQRAVQKGITVRSLNRGGRPAWDNTPWLDKVEWFKGDVFSKDDLQKAVAGTTGVISTVGAFGSNEHMQRFCGDATIAAVRAAKEAGTERFVFISESRVGSNIPKWAPLYGYFNGKERAEAAVRAHFPDTGVSLRPGFVYGTRRVHVNNTDLFLPLGLLGAPLALAGRGLGPVSSMLSRVPLLGPELLAVCPVGALAKAAVLSAIAPVHGDVLDTTNIIALGDSFHETVGA